MRELLLIRHGQASFHAEDYDQLSPLGVQQSSLLGAWFAECGQQPDLVAMGPRVRHRDTAMPCLDAAGVAAGIAIITPRAASPRRGRLRTSC